MSLFPLPKHVGFTGTQEGMTQKQRTELRLALQELLAQGYIWFHHGDCLGADARASSIARLLGFKIHVHPPVNEKARAFVSYDACEEPLPYLVRNKKIVEASSIMLATPKTVEEELRSGTWSTIRYARKQKVTLNILYPF